MKCGSRVGCWDQGLGLRFRDSYNQKPWLPGLKLLGFRLFWGWSEGLGNWGIRDLGPVGGSGAGALVKGRV